MSKTIGHHIDLRKAATAAASAAAACCLAFSLAACGSSSSSGASSATSAAEATSAAPVEQASYSVSIGHLNSTAHVLAFVAQEEGFFAEEGIDAELTQFSSGTELVSGLESGKLDTAFIGSVPTIVNQSNGHDITVFGGAMTNGHGVVIKPEYTEGLDSWDVTILKGRNVAVPRTTVQELELYMALDKFGLTYSDDGTADVNLVYFESQKDAFNALASAEIDAVTTYSPYTSIAVADGYEVVYNCADIDIFENQPCCRQVALTSALADEPEKFEAYERALIKAYAFTQENHEQTIKDVKVYIDIPEDEIEYELYTPNYCSSSPDPDRIATSALKDSTLEFGYIDKDYDIDALYNTEIYANALSQLLAEDPNNASYQELQEHFNTAD